MQGSAVIPKVVPCPAPLLVLPALVGMLVATAPSPASAQPAFPTRALRMIVPFTPGGFTDLMARTVGEHLSRSLGQPVLIDNRPGANGIIGAEALSKAAPDGYTTGMVIAGHAASQSLYAKLPYHAVKSFEPVSLVGVAPLLLVAGN
ncbi:MAG: tripartite tricarboxylate transporter substrate binding protein, partial [Betaproteobacteria bacterium]|nr:tripartite tricarboxylate transporter substrate binding protein [Betaproteobacteria bacterium]